MLVQILAFLQEHQAALAAAVIAILDFIVEVNPRLAGNNVLSQILHLLRLRKPSELDIALDKLKAAQTSEEKLAAAEAIAKALSKNQ